MFHFGNCGRDSYMAQGVWGCRGHAIVRGGGKEGGGGGSCILGKVKMSEEFSRQQTLYALPLLLSYWESTDGFTKFICHYDVMGRR